MSSGFDGDDVGADRADGESGGDAGDDVGGGNAAVQQQHVHQLPGAFGVTIDLAGLGPERVVGLR